VRREGEGEHVHAWTLVLVMGKDTDQDPYAFFMYPKSFIVWFLMMLLCVCTSRSV